MTKVLDPWVRSLSGGGGYRHAFRSAYHLLSQKVAEGRELADLRPMLDRIRPYSMLPEARLLLLARQVRELLSKPIPGAMVECGAWKGGASFLMADLLKRANVEERTVWLFDSFEGHRPPLEIDGPAAKAYAEDTDSPGYRDNCRVAIEDVIQTAESLGLSSFTQIVKGWFEVSLPETRERIGPIALLRIDCDWHSSVLCCLESLYDQVSPGGFVILDDYYDYDGCAIAVHEFLAKHRLQSLLQCW